MIGETSRDGEVDAICSFTKVLGLFLLVAMGFGAGVVASSYKHQRKSITEDIRQEADDAGAGQWVIDAKTGERTWQWIGKKE